MYANVLGAVHKCQHFQLCTNQTLSEAPPPKEYTLTFLIAKNPHENNKNQAKKLKVYGKNVDFPRKVYVLYTGENIDIFGRLLRQLIITPVYDNKYVL